MTRKRGIPFSAQFSTGEVDLPRLLQILIAHAGDRQGIIEAIQQVFHKTGEKRETRAYNTYLAVRDYGLLDRDTDQPTSLARDLLKLKARPKQLYDTFARHILLNLNGIEAVNTVLAMQAAGETINLNTLRRRLGERGLHFPSGGTHFSGIKSWLARAGVFTGGRGYAVDERRFKALVGASVEDVEAIAEMTPQQRAFLRALANLAPDEEIPANKVRDYAATLYGVEFDEKQVPRLVVEPLADLGFIEWRRASMGKGRGGKSHLVKITERLKREHIDPLVDALAQSSGLPVRAVARLNLADILQDLDAKSTAVKGRALELLAIYLTRLLDLTFVGWQLRGKATGGAEVDVVVEGERLIFSRWQIQCKNTARVAVGDVATEVGLALTSLKSNVILVVSTGRMGTDAQKYAKEVLEKTNLQLVLLDKSHLDALALDPSRIANFLCAQASNALVRAPKHD